MFSVGSTLFLSTLSISTRTLSTLPFSTLVDSALSLLDDVIFINFLVESNSTNGPPTDSESVGVLSATWSVSTVC